MHRDVEFISRWSFECNLQETWTYYRSHMSEWCLRATSKMGNAGNEKSHAIIFWSFLSVLGRLSPVRHRDEEYISRWSFESNLQEIWTHLRRHMSEWCLRVTSEMCNGKEKSHVINSWSFLSVLETLCLVRRRDVEYFSRWSFECNLHEIWGCYRRHMSEWCLQITSEMGNGKEKSHAIIFLSISPFLLSSIVRHRDVASQVQ